MSNKTSWQSRSVDSFGPNFKIETASPKFGMSGSRIYAITGSSESGNTSIEMADTGNLDITVDETLTLAGGGGKGNGGAEGSDKGVNIVSTNGTGISVTADSGKITIKGTSILIKSDTTIEFEAGGDINFNNKGNSINLNCETLNTTAKYSRSLWIRDVSWMGMCFGGTQIPTDRL